MTDILEVPVIENETDCNDKEAWKNGDCCCNCALRMPVNKHPCNRIARGDITVKFANVCMFRFDHLNTTPFIMEWEHGICKNHYRKGTINHIKEN